MYNTFLIAFYSSTKNLDFHRDAEHLNARTTVCGSILTHAPKNLNELHNLFWLNIIYIRVVVFIHIRVLHDEERTHSLALEI